jgi:Leucine-rich repeat (LRR) protein
LTELNIASNALTDISALSSLTEMLYFDFSYNQVDAIPAFPKKCALVTINGSNNKISSLDALSGLKNLNNVHMDYNTEISLLKWLERCPYLIRVSVFGTKVTDASCLTDQEIIVNYNPVQ